MITITISGLEFKERLIKLIGIQESRDVSVEEDKVLSSLNLKNKNSRIQSYRDIIKRIEAFGLDLEYTIDLDKALII